MDRNGTKMATSERVYNVILDVYVMLSDENMKIRQWKCWKIVLGFRRRKLRKVNVRNVRKADMRS